MSRRGSLPDKPATPSPSPGFAGISICTLGEAAPAEGRPLLLDDHLLILVTAGHGSQEIDFRRLRCRPGTLLLARPGQVIRFGRQPGLDATVLRWESAAMSGFELRTADADPIGPARWQLAGEDQDAIISELTQVVIDCRRYPPGPLTTDLLRHQLAVLLLRIALLPADKPRLPASEVATFQRLRREVERSYSTTRRVEDYAHRLGCSVRTLTRACLAVTGRSAKQIIDGRVALQAMRLLAATDTPIAEIGRSLGFSEPTNFGRFFHREVGRSPGTFRAEMTTTAPLIPAPRRPAAARPWRTPVLPHSESTIWRK